MFILLLFIYRQWPLGPRVVQTKVTWHMTYRQTILHVYVVIVYCLYVAHIQSHILSFSLPMTLKGQIKVTVLLSGCISEMLHHMIKVLWNTYIKSHMAFQFT